MRKIQLFKLVIPALLLSAAPLAAQCRMAYSVSVYTDGSVSDDLSTVYGYSNFVDNSTLCGYTHSNYQSIVTIYAPDGSYVSNQNAGTESSTNVATSGSLGTYNVVGTASLYCSGAEEQIQSGGPSTPVQVTASVSLTLDKTACTIHQVNDTCMFIVGAYVNAGWTSPSSISGSITVSVPQNPNSISLAVGTDSINPSFTLTPGGATNGSCSPTPNTFCYIVTTSKTNPNIGPLTYGVTLNNGPNSNYTIPSGHQTQTVIVTVQQ